MSYELWVVSCDMTFTGLVDSGSELMAHRFLKSPYRIDVVLR